MDPRQELVDYLTRQLVGPAGGDDQVLDAPPDRQYLMGTLYPQQAELQRQLALAADDPEAPGAEEDAPDVNPATDPVPETNSWLPASLGLSFYTDATQVEVSCTAARYETQRNELGRGRRWQRVPLPPETHTIGPDRKDVPVLDGRAKIHVTRRTYGDGSLITVALINEKRHDGSDGKAPSWDDMLFQCGLTVRPADGSVLPYPSVRLASRDPEERELRLQYRHVVTHAVGHGCAVREERGEDDTVELLACEVLPRAEVPAIRAGGPLDAPVLTLSHLADPSVGRDQLLEELADFAAAYRAWYVGQRSVDVPAWGQEAAERILGRIHQAVTRIEAGVRTLCDPDRPELLAAFRIAQRAMLLQMRHSAPDQAGERRRRSDAVALDPPVDPKATWRPFQLAFFLLALDGVAEPGHRDRRTTDLIWFPTGGGKTEAYLLLAAFTIALRRIRGEGGGTAVLSRYTLSLLTTQQFQRAATTICALEHLRRTEPELGLGGPITIGLWVGETTTPNSFQKAKDAFQQQYEASHPEDVFILDRCPWCGTRILPPSRSSVRADYGIRAKTDEFAFYCTRDDCDFHDVLPVAVVDQHLYKDPPTFVLGTVDKFARLAWEPDSGSLFGAGTRNPPPSLIIQDELHLLTGPLGTTVGLYEAAILELCTGPDGHPPKIVAATATIRRSTEQVRALHHQDVQLFPPSGLDARDSFFAVPDTGRPGRLYLGVMAQGHTAGRGAVATTAAMLQGVHQLPEEHRDAYWTLVAYHHSLRELGRTVTAAGDDIPAQLRGLDDGTGIRALGAGDVQQLTSNVPPRAEQPVLLDRLEKPWDDSRSVSFLPCTNMLSVGVDVKRLAYMLMQGQPKTTAEYIQATSRVGRHRVPGLVVTYFNATRPRDRSHYETFIDYHRALYRYVEPASVTPWSPPARRRALHAALVVLVRHRLGLAAENQAGRITGHQGAAERIADALAERAATAERGATGADADAVRADVRQELSYLLEDWYRQARTAAAEGKDLYYRSQGKGQYNLLKAFEQRYGLWETLNSMRSVDRECQITVTGAGK
ncbi:helicase-related protein [Streptomyces sp. NPDC007206]|uniref:helicase-related protein n=1 Tax=Streptomyces sp. NPDC007206 TaxID=3154317 RepID=UPI00340953BE